VTLDLDEHLLHEHVDLAALPLDPADVCFELATQTEQVYLARADTGLGRW
jgi:hypothetical protein